MTFPGRDIPAPQVRYTEDPIILTARANADGTLQAITDTGPRYGERWIVSRITVRCNSTTRATALVYIADTADPLALVSGTNSGNYDEADYTSDTGLLVPHGRRLTVIWSGVTAPTTGALTASAIIQYARLVDIPA